MDQDSKLLLMMLRKAFNAAKRRSIKKSVKFNITVCDLQELYAAQHGLCQYSGIEMNVAKNSESLHDPYKMTIDCKDQSVGYIKSNIALCLYCINSLKQRMPYLEMLSICDKIISNTNAKN